jgi:CheY-like chemotaxis protein
LRGLGVLVVDDNPTSREILQDMLESFSFHVTLAESGEKGLAAIENASRQQPVDLVIMDWKMPGMDGIETARRIKGNPQLSKIPPIILVTAYGREEILQQAESAGLEGFLIKPVSPSTLFDAVMQAFGRESLDETRAAPVKASKTVTIESIRGARLLLVEDNEINQQVAREILESAGLQISIANNGQEAVDMVKETIYDAVLMDIQMPVMDGYAATRIIRELEDRGQMADDRGQKTEERQQRKEGEKLGRWEGEKKSEIQNPKSKIKGVPIIAMTAHAMAGDDQKSLAAGMNGHVTKPIDPEQLFSTLLKWIKPRQELPEAITGSERAGQDAADSASAVAKDSFPVSLAGFDFEDGLKRLRGNEKLYTKLLRNFAAKYAGMAADIDQAIESLDFEQAHGMVHSLKGMAGNLAAVELQSAAIGLEKLVKHANHEKPPANDELKLKFAKLDDALNQAIQSIQAFWAPDQANPAAAEIGTPAAVPPELAREAAHRLHDAAEMGDVSGVVAVIDDLQSRSNSFTPYKAKIIQLADDFDFEGVLKMAGEFEKMAG